MEEKKDEPKFEVYLSLDEDEILTLLSAVRYIWTYNLDLEEKEWAKLENLHYKLKGYLP